MIAFVCGLFACYWGANESDRKVWLCLIVAGVVSMAINASLSSWSSFDEPLVSMSIEALAILLIMRTNRTPLADSMVFLLSIAWIAHLSLFSSYLAGTDLIYGIYLPVIYSVAVIQLALGSNGIAARIIRMLEGARSHYNPACPSGDNVSQMAAGKNGGREAVK